jgi:hypothetical protein
MYDFNKSDLIGLPINALLNNQYLDFKFECSQKTGELFENSKVSQYNGIEKFCTIKNNQYTTLKFSYHKYFNPENKNHTDFTISNYLDVLTDLSDKFEINPYLTTLHNLEFGVNITLPFKTKTFLNSIISYKGKEYRKETFKCTGNLLRFEFEQYELKIYDKGKQYQLQDNILRFEIKVTKMEFLTAKKITAINYTDLLQKNTIENLSKLLLKAFTNLLIYDNTINLRAVKNQKEREILLNGKNPKFWSEIQNNNTLKSKRQRFKNLVLKHSTNDNQNLVYNLIKNKLAFVNTIDKTTEQNITNYLSKFNKETTPNITAFLTANSKPNYTQYNSSSIGLQTVYLPRYCLTCGNDITNQRKGSVFCSEKLHGKSVKKCRNQKSNPTNNYKRKELKLYLGCLLLFDITEIKISKVG